MSVLSNLPSRCSAAGVLILLLVVGCVKPQTESWPIRLNAAMADRATRLSDQERAEYEAGFTNGASMVNEALKAGVRPYRPVLNGEVPVPRNLGPAQEGQPTVPFNPVTEVDPISGLLLHPASGAKGSAFARGQVDGFDWALAAVGRPLLRPVPDPGTPKGWFPWENSTEEQNLQFGQRTVGVRWAPRFLGWTWKERGFPDRRNWRPWDDSAAPTWIALSEQALWVESGNGQVMALDLESGGILRVMAAVPHAVPKKTDWESYQKSVVETFHSPAFQQGLGDLRNRATSGKVEDLMALAKHLGGMGPEAEREAFACYLKAAEMGEREAMLKVGVLLFHGQSVPADKAASRMWLRRAAKAGHAHAVAVEEMLFQGEAPKP